MGFSRQEYWRGCHAPLQRIFPTQGLNPGLPHCKQILYWLSHQGSPSLRYSWQIKYYCCILPTNIPKWFLRVVRCKKIKKSPLGPPWWLSGKESAHQCKRHEVDPRSRSISHAAEWGDLCAPATENVRWARELQLLKPIYPKPHAPQQEKSLQWEDCTPHLESSPCSLQPEKTKQQRPSTARNK